MINNRDHKSQGTGLVEPLMDLATATLTSKSFLGAVAGFAALYGVNRGIEALRDLANDKIAVPLGAEPRQALSPAIDDGVRDSGPIIMKDFEFPK